MTSPQQLPRTLEAAHAVIATLSEKLSQTVRENELLRQKIDKLCRRLFGQGSEKVSAEQLALAFAQLPQEEGTETESPSAEGVGAVEETASETSRPRPSPTGRKAFPSTCRASACSSCRPTRILPAAAGSARPRSPRR